MLFSPSRFSLLPPSCLTATITTENGQRGSIAECNNRAKGHFVLCNWCITYHSTQGAIALEQ